MHVDRRLLARAHGARKYLVLTVALAVASAVFVVLQAHFLSRVIGGAFLEGLSLSELLPLLVIFVALAAGRSASSWAGEVSAQRVAGRVKVDLRAALTENLLTRGPGYARGERTGELTSVLVQGVEALDAYLGQYLPRLFTAAVVPLVVLTFVLPADPVSAIVLLVTAPLIPLFMFLIGSLAERRTRRQWLALRRMNAHFLDVLQGLATLKMLGRSREQAGVIRATSERFHHTTMGVLRIAFLSALVLEMTAMLGTAVVAVGVGLRLVYARLGFEEALFVLILAPELYRPLRQLGSAFHTGLPGAEAAKSIFAVLAAPGASLQVTALAAEEPATQGRDPVDVEFRGVSFAYESGRRPALEGVSFRIPAGHKVGLVGPIGAGKSTVAHLLLRFAEPTRGVILADGVPLGRIDARSWRSRLSWVPQSPHLFHGTVAENIRLAARDASQEEVIEAARLARLHEAIEELPLGYETPIGEGGARLSGGQAQRLALARAFLKDAPLLVLDEPTSQLDPEQEELVQESLRRLLKGRTVLLIAHRLNTVFDASKIVLLSRGRVVEEGSHAALLENGRLYPRLVAAFGGVP